MLLAGSFPDFSIFFLFFFSFLVILFLSPLVFPPFAARSVGVRTYAPPPVPDCFGSFVNVSHAVAAQISAIVTRIRPTDATPVERKATQRPARRGSRFSLLSFVFLKKTPRGNFVLVPRWTRPLSRARARIKKGYCKDTSAVRDQCTSSHHEHEVACFFLFPFLFVFVHFAPYLCWFRCREATGSSERRPIVLYCILFRSH